MSFLYVEPYEVRHEILTRVEDLGDWMDLELRGDRYIEVDELEPLKQRIGAFLLDKTPVLVDGEALRPILDRKELGSSLSLDMSKERRKKRTREYDCILEHDLVSRPPTRVMMSFEPNRSSGRLRFTLEEWSGPLFG